LILSINDNITVPTVEIYDNYDVASTRQGTNIKPVAYNCHSWLIQMNK